MQNLRRGWGCAHAAKLLEYWVTPNIGKLGTLNAFKAKVIVKAKHCQSHNGPKVPVQKGRGGGQSRKNPVSASAMLTGKFLQIRKFFATSSLLAEEFLDTLQYKISR